MNEVIEKKPVSQVAIFQKELEERKAALAQILPAQIPVDKFIRTTLTATLINPVLLNADRKSLMVSCMKAAQDGLLCDGREAALVIFNSKVKGEDGKDTWIKKVQYMPMAAGLLKKMRNTGELASISAHVVHAKDKFSYSKGDDEKITHEPYLEGDAGEVKFAYAIAKLKDGSIQREVMTRGEIEKVRAVSKAKDDGPWTSWYDEMARKSVVRRLSKYLPSSPEIEGAIRHDDENYDLVDVTPENEETTTSSVKKKLKAKAIEHKAEEIMPEPKIEEEIKEPAFLHDMIEKEKAANA